MIARGADRSIGMFATETGVGGASGVDGMGRGSSGVPVRAGARRGHPEQATAVPGHRRSRDTGTGSGAGPAAVAPRSIVTVDTVDTVGGITLASAAFPRT